MSKENTEKASNVNRVLYVYLSTDHEWDILSNKCKQFTEDFPSAGDKFQNLYGEQIDTKQFLADLEGRIKRLDEAVSRSKGPYPEMMMDIIKVYQALQVAVHFYGPTDPDRAKGFSVSSLKAGEIIGQSAATANQEPSQTISEHATSQKGLFSGREMENEAQPTTSSAKKPG